MRIWNKTLKRSYAVLSDKFNSFPIIMEAEHNAVHEGYHYHISYGVADMGAMTTPNDMITLSFTTPTTASGLFVHMIFAFKSSSGALAKIIEGQTGGGATPTGTLQTYNNNRVSTNTSKITDVAGANESKMSYDATEFTGGTTIHSEYIGAAGFLSISGGTDRGSNEWILSPETLYQATLFTTANVPGTISLTWYEYDGKNYH